MSRRPNRREIDSIYGKVREKGLTLVPTRLYFKDGRVKVELALARGKERADKRRALAELNEALKMAQPIQFPSNIELVKKYYDKLAEIGGGGPEAEPPPPPPPGPGSKKKK